MEWVQEPPNLKIWCESRFFAQLVYSNLAEIWHESIHNACQFKDVVKLAILQVLQQLSSAYYFQLKFSVSTFYLTLTVFFKVKKRLKCKM